jgi:hypothetical protein
MEGRSLGLVLGAVLGAMLGDSEGKKDGARDGNVDGSLLGVELGDILGMTLGGSVDAAVGSSEGLVDSRLGVAAGSEVMFTSTTTIGLSPSTQQSRYSSWRVGQQKMLSCAHVGCAEQRRGIETCKSRPPAPRTVPEASAEVTADGNNDIEAINTLRRLFIMILRLLFTCKGSVICVCCCPCNG